MIQSNSKDIEKLPQIAEILLSISYFVEKSVLYLTVKL